MKVSSVELRLLQQCNDVPRVLPAPRKTCLAWNCLQQGRGWQTAAFVEACMTARWPGSWSVDQECCLHGGEDGF